ncbi:hypothetical protein OBBRIDRAFT_803567 [Obba rivulosa]|uniref:Uncharacterized protein n=1 Tax=Obba rivulosa TaxID=1052685 RepID=A0A8E2DK13_9APHY|nr:hypothetical protein OBBRIDRAFT_803567 [Obba rivulosa]
MPSLATVVSAIVGGCVLLTLLLSYTIWLKSKDNGVHNSVQTAMLCSSLSAIRGGLSEPKPICLRTPPPLYETRPFSKEVRITFPSGLNEDTASSVSQDLTEVCISEELEIAEIAEEIAGILGARPIRKSPSPQGRVVRPNPKQYGLWGSVVFRSGVVAGHGLSFGEGRD